MSHIATVGRRSARVRLGIAALYAVLIFGAVTTLYPFVLMVVTATKSQVDFTEIDLIPKYWISDSRLLAKYAEDRYAANLEDINAVYGTQFARPTDVAPPADANRPGRQKLAAHWQTFQQTLPLLYKQAGFGQHDNAPSLLLLRYQNHLREKFRGDITRLNQAWTEENVSFQGVVPPFERTARREWVPDFASPKVRNWEEFKQALPPEFLITAPADSIYRRFLRDEMYDDDLARLNTAWKTNYADWTQITLPRRLADTPVGAGTGAGAARENWERFVRTKLPLRLLRVDQSALPSWQRFLRQRNRANSESAAFPDPLPASGNRLTDFMEWVATRAPASALSADTAENRWRADLRREFGSVAAANTAFGTDWREFANAQPPQALADWNFVRANRAGLRTEMATRNFRLVADYILLHGRALVNTFAFCVLAILGAVIVNPLCAYALSRYPLPYAYKVLLFLLATMAFPAEVAMIPNFLLLKDLGMLNTFWALVLPGLASGFSIFLLKGFFDSLPKELYEAAILDGAKELQMFRNITVPLSLPIFSVIALNAFTAAYGAFLFALVVCQDPKMWTLMVWLYDLQATAPQYVIMAALTLAALPTLIVFLFAQKVILRGIILPSFK